MRNASRNIKLLAAVGFIAALAAVPATISFSQLQQQPSSVPEPQQPGDAGQTNSNDTTTNNQSSSSSSSAANTTMGNNQTTTGVNQTAPTNTTTSAQEEEEGERTALARSLRENITSGDVKVLMVTTSQQPDVPAQHEQRDIDPLGLVNFTDAAATTTMRIIPPEYASGENLTSTLYKEGKLSFIFENLTLQEPDDVDVLFISKDATEMRTPVAIGDDDTGIDNEFEIPATLKDDGAYLVLVTMHWSEIQQDVIMAIDGRSLQVEE